MISQIGSLALSISGGLILSTFFFLFYYSIKKNKLFLEIAERGLIAICFCIILATLCLLNELLISNFNLQYVAQYTSYETPLFFKFTALWAEQEGETRRVLQAAKATEESTEERAQLRQQEAERAFLEH